jgi:hypothetical protein
MKTPHLDREIKHLSTNLTELGKSVFTEYKAIKQLIENYPIVSTPENPVWVLDERGNKRILLVDFGEKSIHRYISIARHNEADFLEGKEFDWDYHNKITPYTPKVTIEVTQEESIKVQEFLKGLRDGK